MSKYGESFFHQTPDGVRQSPKIVELAAEYPEMTQVLLGVKRAENDGASIPTASIILFLEGDAMKFCLKPKYGGNVAFGTLQDPVKGFQELERALRDGDFEWKKSGK